MTWRWAATAPADLSFRLIKPLYGRCHLLKMVSFAWLLYPLQTLPILLKHSDVTTLNKVFRAFLWRNKKNHALHFKHTISQRVKVDCDYLTLDFTICLVCCQGIDWITGESKYTNYDLESALVSPYAAVLHSKLTSLPISIWHNLLLKLSHPTKPEIITGIQYMSSLYTPAGVLTSPLCPLPEFMFRQKRRCHWGVERHYVLNACYSGLGWIWQLICQGIWRSSLED